MEISRSGGAGGQNVNKAGDRRPYRPQAVGNRRELYVDGVRRRTKGESHEIAHQQITSKDRTRRKRASAAPSVRRKSAQATAPKKIRTYNFPQDRVTDHRIKESWSNVPKIMASAIAPILEALEKAETGTI